MTELNLAEWRKSTYSGGGNCVEVAGGPAAVAVRDSKDPSVPPLAFRREEWAAFTGRVKHGQFNRW